MVHVDNAKKQRYNRVYPHQGGMGLTLHDIS